MDMSNKNETYERKKSIFSLLKLIIIGNLKILKIIPYFINSLWWL